MVETRRPRAATVEKRARILDAAEQIMLREGYAAVTSRRVEAVAGVKLHYHFGTVDDLFVAVFRRRAERNVERIRDALTSPQPLRAWWELASDPRGTALLVELTAAANHRAPLQAEVAELARDVRRMEMEALASILDEYGIDPDEFPPALVAAAVQGLALVVVQDEVRGFDTAHTDAKAAIERLARPARGATRRGLGAGEPVGAARCEHAPERRRQSTTARDTSSARPHHSPTLDRRGPLECRSSLFHAGSWRSGAVKQPGLRCAQAGSDDAEISHRDQRFWFLRNPFELRLELVEAHARPFVGITVMDDDGAANDAPRRVAW